MHSGRLARITVALLSALGILIAASGSATAAVRPYREIDLGSTGGPRAASDAVAINDYGSAVGVSQTPDGPHGTLWRADGTKVDLGREPLPVDIDNQGDIALAGSYGVVLHADGSRPTTYANGLLPYRMNNAGQLILRRPDASSPSGFRYYLGTTNAEYGVFGFPANWVMSDLNDQGQVDVLMVEGEAPEGAWERVTEGGGTLPTEEIVADGLETAKRAIADRQPAPRSSTTTGMW